MADTDKLPRIMVIDPDPGEHLRAIVASDQVESVAVVTSVDEIAPVIARARPDIVFQFKMPGLSGAATRSLFENDNVRWIQYAGVGTDHYVRWDPDRTVVTNSAGVLSDFMAEYVMGALLAANIGFPRYWQIQAAQQWQADGWTGLKGKTLLIVGLGHIGAAVAHRAAAFDMRVIGTRSRPRPMPNVATVFASGALAEIVGEADFIAIHVPLTAETTALFDAALFDRIQPHAILINTSRGGVVDEHELAARLRDGRLRAAVVDVFATEPLPPDNTLWSVPNLMLTPHMSDSVSDWKARSVEFFLTNLIAYRSGRPLQNPVLP